MFLKKFLLFNSLIFIYCANSAFSQVVPSCKDTFNQCGYYSREDCVRDFIWMRRNCAFTCGYCTAGNKQPLITNRLASTISATTTKTTTTPTTTSTSTATTAKTTPSTSSTSTTTATTTKPTTIVTETTTPTTSSTASTETPTPIENTTLSTTTTATTPSISTTSGATTEGEKTTTTVTETTTPTTSSTPTASTATVTPTEKTTLSTTKTTTATTPRPSVTELEVVTRISAIINFANDTITRNKIVIFSMTTCPYCILAKNIFTRNNAKYVAIEFDRSTDCPYSDCALLSHYLAYITGMTTVPKIFINGKLIGGSGDLGNLERSGELNELLAIKYN